MSEGVLDEFIFDCKCRGYTKRTLETYKSNVRYYLRHEKVDFNQSIDNFELYTNFEKLKKFLDHLKKRKLANSTINGYFAALSTFFDYLYVFHKTDINEIPIFRRRYLRQKKRYNNTERRQLISIEKMQELITEPLRTQENLLIRNFIRTVPARDHAIFMLFAKTGARKEEIRHIEIDDIDLDKGLVWVKSHFAKRSNCLCFIDDETIQALRLYLKWRSAVVRPDNKYLLLTHTGCRLQKDDLYYITTYYAKIIGIHNRLGPLGEKFTPHCFRHWFTTNLRRSGMSREYRKWLRGDAPEGADDWYDQLQYEWGEIKTAYLKHMPTLKI
ncbi:MAG TPA: hypothetical protein DCG34_05115 [Clostridiales bacterium]|nr:hypothetical protein [Clostridiales bacterium]